MAYTNELYVCFSRHTGNIGHYFEKLGFIAFIVNRSSLLIGGVVRLHVKRDVLIVFFRRRLDDVKLFCPVILAQAIHLLEP